MNRKHLQRHCRRLTGNMTQLLRLKLYDLTIAWLCALPKSELAAATLMLEERHENFQLSQQNGNL